MKRCLALLSTCLLPVYLGACDQFESPSTTQCQAAVDKIVPEATLKTPDKAQCTRSVDATLPGAKKRPAPKKEGVLGKISGALDTAVGKVKGAAHKLTDEYESAVATCEKDWSLATAQCVEKAKNPGESKACKATGEAQEKAYKEAMITCETGWNMAMVSCINGASARKDMAACVAWPWSSPDTTILGLLGDEAPKEEEAATN